MLIFSCSFEAKKNDMLVDFLALPGGQKNQHAPSVDVLDADDQAFAECA